MSLLESGEQRYYKSDQQLVYKILLPTIAITDYAIDLSKLSANGQFFVGAHMVVTL